MLNSASLYSMKMLLFTFPVFSEGDSDIYTRFLERKAIYAMIFVLQAILVQKLLVTETHIQCSKDKKKRV